MSRLWSMCCRLAPVFAASAGLNLALVTWGRDPFTHILTIVPLIWISLLCACRGLMIACGEAGSAVRRRGRSLVMFAAVLGSSILSIPFASLDNRLELDRAIRYCESLRPALERYHEAHGRYPDRLADLPIPRPLPRLLRGGDFYRPRGQFYEFTIDDPSSMLAGYDFNSQDGRWNYWD